MYCSCNEDDAKVDENTSRVAVLNGDKGQIDWSVKRVDKYGNAIVTKQPISLNETIRLTKFNEPHQNPTVNSIIYIYNELNNSLVMADEVCVPKNDQIRKDTTVAIQKIGIAAATQLIKAGTAILESPNDDADKNKESKVKNANNTEDGVDGLVSVYALMDRAKVIIAFANQVGLNLNLIKVNNSKTIYTLTAKIAEKILGKVLDSCNNFVNASGQEGLQGVLALELGERTAKTEETISSGRSQRLRCTGKLDATTIAALKKYLYFVGENPGKISNKKMDNVAEQALLSFLAKVECFGVGSIFDSVKLFLRNQGIDVKTEERNENGKYRLLNGDVHVPIASLQQFLVSAAADVHPFKKKSWLQCSLEIGVEDTHGLCANGGHYYPMGKYDGKPVWRSENFSKLQYNDDLKVWNWYNWENKIVVSIDSSNYYPPVCGWKDVEGIGKTKYASKVTLTYFNTSPDFIVTRMLKAIDKAQKMANEHNVIQDSLEYKRIQTVKHAIAKVCLRVAVDSGDKNRLNSALALANKLKLPSGDGDKEKALNLKIAYEVGAEMMAIKRQPTISNEIIENLAAPDSIYLEIRRREYFKNGDSIDCPQCVGPGNRDGIEDSCWMCLGTGKTSKHITELKAPDNSTVDCLICYDVAEYGLSTVCTHFFCSRCIRMTLETALEMGQIPMYCPACKAAHGGKDSKKPKVGRIEETVLTFLARRNIISKDLQFRIMMAERKKRNASEQGKEFFACPGRCGNYLIHEDPGSEMKIVKGKEGHKLVVWSKPGVCKCGVLVCVRCHCKLTQKTWETHDCNASKGSEIDAKTLATLRANAKQCPNCQAWVQKNDGCDTMMCGTNSHGSILQAIRNGGCGHQFYWTTLKPANTFYQGMNGERRSGFISAEYRKKCIEKVFGEQKNKYNVK
eukprot:g8266.t1